LLLELLHRASQTAPTDPVVFSRLANIIPDPWQAALLASTAQQILLNCSRQSGKSTTTATLAMHTALYTADSLILLLSPGLRQSGELFRKCLQVSRAAGDPVRAQSATALTLTLANGSRLVSLPGKDGTVRGYSGARLIVIDEAAWVLDALYFAVRPMLAVSGGRLVVLSTPFGKRGFFYDAWTRGGADWQRFEVPATACPRIAPSFLAAERRAMPEARYLQEYCCQFREVEDAAFTHEQIVAALAEDVDPLWEG
jgi:hypothetical protein